MKKEIFLLVLCLSALGSMAEEPASRFSVRTHSGLGPLGWNTSESHWDRILEERRSTESIQLGKSDFVFSSPLVDAFRRERLPADAPAGRRFLNLPIVRLFVPQKMPLPPGGTGSYFAWRDSERPWVDSAGLAGKPPGSSFNQAFNMPVSFLGIGR